MAADTTPGESPAEPPSPPVVVTRRPDYPGPLLRTTADYGWRLLILGAVVYFAVRLLSHLGLVVIPFLVSLLVTAVLRQPLNFLQRRGFRRGIATVATVVGAAVVLGGLMTVVVIRAAHQAPQLGDEINKLIPDVKR